MAGAWIWMPRIRTARSADCRCILRVPGQIKPSLRYCTPLIAGGAGRCSPFHRKPKSCRSLPPRGADFFLRAIAALRMRSRRRLILRVHDAKHANAADRGHTLRETDEAAI